MWQKQREIFGILHVCSSVITYLILFFDKRKDKERNKKEH